VSGLLDLRREARRRARAQTRFYRHLSARAEASGDAQAAERLNELLADEQHHVSRVTARLLELGAEPDGSDEPRPEGPLEGWEARARAREEAEVAWYGEAVERVEDEATRVVLEEILASERHHLSELGGKWMAASPPSTARSEDPRPGSDGA